MHLEIKKLHIKEWYISYVQYTNFNFNFFIIIYHNSELYKAASQ